MMQPKQRLRCRDLGIVFRMGKKKKKVCLLCLVHQLSHQTSWIMVLITTIDESNLQNREPTAKVQEDCPVGTAAE